MSAPPPEAERRLKEDLYRLEAYRNQLNALLQQHQLLTASRSEHRRATDSLAGLDRTAPGAELLIPLGADTFLRGSAVPNARLLVGIGSGVVVELEREKVAELIAQRLTRLDQAANDLEAQIQTVDERVQMISQRVEAMAQGPAEPGRTGVVDVGGD